VVDMKNKERIELLEKRISDIVKYIDLRLDELSNEKEQEKTELIEIPFQLDKYGHVVFKDKRINPDAFFNYFIDENIDQSKIKRILIEMKETK